MAEKKKKGYNPKSLENLKFPKPGETHNPNGRPKKLVNVIKGLPKDAQEKVYSTLAYVLTLPDEETAKEYLEVQKGELGKYGFVLQIAIRQLTSKGWGWGAMMDILDRLYGKPTINASVDARGEGVTIVVKSQEEADKLKNIGDLQV